ncbi:MAG: phosphoribosylanthranilate isomerase [Alphaproteobacteria bacterium]|nr:MAG: phosphoribosylanthranilate isomerase [Alphaproteobacteria bacterium]
MRVGAKICGLSTLEAVAAAQRHGACMIGFVFHPGSPRRVTPAGARALGADVPPSLARVGVFVDPADDEIDAALGAIDMIQLHGAEPPARVRAVRRRAGRPVIKAIAVADASDLAAVEDYEMVADLLLFDAKPPPGPAALPGGNARAFDWRLLAGVTPRVPWLLSGGLDAGNVADAIRVSGAPLVDVSSGVESARGVKDPARIAAFLAACKELETA